ncbi:MAG TPA: sulfotransferase [Actinomycetota bacterium]|nr:sulfotransferase [Actinomycetota bacterium]
MGEQGTDAAASGPIYIGGAGRSGKTLVRWMLASHSRIAVSRRTAMWTEFYGRFGDLADPDNLERCLRAMLERRHIAELGTDLEQLRRNLLVGTPTYARLFTLFHEQYATRAGKARWGDQTGLAEGYAAEIFAQQPQARFLHLIRDPRDVVGARLERGPRRPGAVGRITGIWRSSAASALRNRRRYTGRYHVIRYEDLVASPEATMRGVCAFIGEEFQPAMLQMDDVGRYDAVRAASVGGAPISTEFVGRYRRLISRADVALIQSLAEREMILFDYLVDPIRLSPAERIRYAAGWPLSVARMGRSA